MMCIHDTTVVIDPTTKHCVICMRNDVLKDRVLDTALLDGVGSMPSKTFVTHTIQNKLKKQRNFRKKNGA